MIDLILIGGGGHCKACIDVIEQEGEFNIAGIVDQKENLGNKILGYPVIGCDDDIESIQQKYNHFFIAVGQIVSSKLRRKLKDLVESEGTIFPSIVSPLAYISKHAEIGVGNIIMHRVIVNAGAEIGSFNIFNTNSIIEHDCIIKDFNHISVSTTICGTVTIGSDCFIGASSTINNNINLSDSIFVGSNTLINKNLTEKGIYAGNPVRKYR